MESRYYISGEFVCFVCSIYTIFKIMKPKRINLLCQLHHHPRLRLKRSLRNAQGDESRGKTLSGYTAVNHTSYSDHAEHLKTETRVVDLSLISKV